MKISNTHHQTRTGLIKKNPKRFVSVTRTKRFKDAFTEGDSAFREKLSRKENESVVVYNIRINNLLRSKKEKRYIRNIQNRMR